MTKPKNLEDYCFVVFDLETTGFSPTHDHILEIGAMSIYLDTLEVLNTFEIVVKPQAAYRPLHPDVQSMHETSGLLAAVDADGVELAWAESKLASWFQEIGARDKNVVLCGNSISFDRGFVDAHLTQRTHQFLSHRMFDVRTTMFEAEAWRGVRWPDMPSVMPHRALGDCKVSLDAMKRVRQSLE